MDICSSNTPGLMVALCWTRTVRFGQLVDTAGFGLTNTQAVCSILGLRSSRVVRRFLKQWNQRLRGMLRDYGSGMATPDKQECFPDIRLTPALGELAGPLYRNVSILTCSGVRLALFFEAIFPAAEKRRSEGVEVAGIHKNDMA
ncbi:hypothetical protein NHX12_003791 [Muraenolepis orangiensis]|uniref:Uncharacterized protein n=1 Tax=Muraenolepis orangiensis TaxID=630683 RepID=A0A9Q0DRQ7_9TELE|nr:hypothetical protein NHX12_003791 [Muraenolepis orangiensis]